jgi:hypothetical protein
MDLQGSRQWQCDEGKVARTVRQLRGCESVLAAGSVLGAAAPAGPAVGPSAAGAESEHERM